jgi:HTH-type transcriptional regulator/antitoxin HipB
MEYSITTAQQLAHALKGAWKSRKLTQGEAGKKVGLLPKTLSALESDPEPSTIGSLLKLLSALDLDLVLREKHNSPGGMARGEW